MIERPPCVAVLFGLAIRRRHSCDFCDHGARDGVSVRPNRKVRGSIVGNGRSQVQRTYDDAVRCDQSSEADQRRSLGHRQPRRMATRHQMRKVELAMAILSTRCSPHNSAKLTSWVDKGPVHPRCADRATPT